MTKSTIVPLVDTHAHIFHLGMPLINNPRHSPKYSFTLEDYLATLDANGVQYGVIAAASPWGDYNDYTEESVGKTPRLRGTVILHPGKQYDFARMSSNGILGVRLPFIGLPVMPDLTTPDYQKLLHQIADAGWHVHPHIEGKHLPALLPILEKAGVNIVVDHLGRPAPDEKKGSPGFEAIVDSVKRGKSWVKVSCGYRIGAIADEHFQGFLDELGPDRLFWASDCPFVGHEGRFPYSATIDWLTDRVSDEAVLKKLTGTNALKFYFDK